ncbi:hypothetical protein L210DRAFT_3551279, partial [Boletus edulis BED1]
VEKGIRTRPCQTSSCRLPSCSSRPTPIMHLRFRPIENFTRPTHVPGWLYDKEKGTFERDEQRQRLLMEEKEVWHDALEEPLPDCETRSLEGRILGVRALRRSIARDRSDDTHTKRSTTFRAEGRVTIATETRIIRRVELILDDLVFLDRIQRRTANRDHVVQHSLDDKVEGWEEKEKDGIVTWNGRVYFPIDSKLWEDVIRELISNHARCA